jgi:hypothetical protein
VTRVKKYPSVGAQEYAAERLTARQYKVNGLTFTEMYSGTRPGQVAKKKLRVGKYFEQPYPYPGSRTVIAINTNGAFFQLLPPHASL